MICESWKAGKLAFVLASFAFQYHALRHTNRLINAVEVLDNLDTLCPNPEDERQLRELAKLRIEGTHQ
jgi:hypothetical protein